MGKILSLTLDNTASNDSMQNILKERLNLKNGLLCDNDFFFSMLDVMHIS